MSDEKNCRSWSHMIGGLVSETTLADGIVKENIPWHDFLQRIERTNIFTEQEHENWVEHSAGNGRRRIPLWPGWMAKASSLTLALFLVARSLHLPNLSSCSSKWPPQVHFRTLCCITRQINSPGDCHSNKGSLQSLQRSCFYSQFLKPRIPELQLD